MLLLGWLWPFMVAAAGVAIIAGGQSLRSDGAITVLCFIALLGSPAVVVTIAGWLPMTYSSELRSGLAVVAAFPVVGLELMLALWMLVVGANAVGPGWLE
jgi:hypothetical protein